MITEYELPRGDELITIKSAYDAMTAFLEAWWRRGGETSDDVANILCGMDRRVLEDGGPMDPAFWDDFLTAIDSVSVRTST